jgi:hypothetical protein
MYGMNVPRGTWMVSMKIDSDAIWQEWVKENRIKGFSIEGMFTRKVDLSADSFLGELEEILEDVRAEVASVKK